MSSQSLPFPSPTHPLPSAPRSADVSQLHSMDTLQSPNAFLTLRDTTPHTAPRRGLTQPSENTSGPHAA